MRTIIYSFFFALSLSANAATFHSIVEKSIDGKEYKLADLKGKVVLVVNIASQCGFTPQLDDLQKLNTTYKDRGVVVLGVPSNDFGGQTPEDDQGMKEFCQKKYNVNFPLLSKGAVKGKETRPLYSFLTQESGESFEGEIGWNFVKFLVDKNGKVVKRWSSMTNPLDKSVTSEIDKLLK